jgi:hypothetical protein
MKRYYDVYLRPADALLAYENMLYGNPMEDWDRLELLNAGASLKMEPESRELGDGTTLCETFKVSFEAATLRVDAAEYAYLRSTFHNVMSDVMFMDISEPKLVAAVHRMRLRVQKVAESGGDLLIRITGEMTVPEDVIDTRLGIFDWEGSVAAVGMVEGFVYDTNGSTPISGAEVSIDDGWTPPFTDTADKDGHFMILAPSGNYDISAAKAGKSFPAPVEIVVVTNESISSNITATA